MKTAVNIARVLVGLLFIFSGLVKANDPLGLSYKMEEFFEIWGMTKFNSWALLMSVLMNAFEIIAGFALLIGWRVRLFTWLFLLLILFFTFLTGYTYITGKPKNCGCFGDCLPISSKTSFLKDVVLTILIGFLFWMQRLIKPIIPERAATITMFGITALAFGFQWYTLNYLPVVDCLPYKKGKNIAEQMKMPANAVPDSIVIMFEYEKDGKRIKFNASNFPPGFDSTYKYIGRKDEVIRKGKNNQPPITGFKLRGVSGDDSTETVLNQPYALLLFIIDFSTPVSKWENQFAELYLEAKAKGVPVYIVSMKPSETPGRIKETPFSQIQVFSCDDKAIRTAARVSPTVYLLKQGTIEGKWSFQRMGAVLSAIQQLPASSNK
jgi:hypothetical protein